MCGKLFGAIHSFPQEYPQISDGCDYKERVPVEREKFSEFSATPSVYCC